MSKLSSLLSLFLVASIGCFMSVESFSTTGRPACPFGAVTTGVTTGVTTVTTCTLKPVAAARSNINSLFKKSATILSMSNDDGVVELATDDEETETETKQQEEGEEEEGEEETTKSSSASAPSVTFLSQGEIDKETLILTDDPKQTRVIIYIILSLIPVLFLIPLMLGSRDLIPLDSLPPVSM